MTDNDATVLAKFVFLVFGLGLTGTVAQLIIGAVIGSAVLGTDESWVKFLAGIGAIVLTFLAGAELDPQIFRLKWKEAVAVDLASFLFPFLGCAAAAPGMIGLSRFNGWPVRSPTDASPAPLRTSAHGSGPMWVATPSP